MADDTTPNMGQDADAYFESIRKTQETPTPVGRDLSKEEDRKVQDGFALEEMMKSQGWTVVQELLESMPKSHIDPRGMSEEEWKFAELNAFWQGQVAKELLEGLYFIVQDAHRLHGVQVGMVPETKKMVI